MDGSRLGLISSAALALTLGLAPTRSQADGWRDLRIDGTSLSALETSVAALQNALPARRREAFEIALATIWTGNAVDSDDFDRDGDVDLDDGFLLKEDTAALLIDIQRGNLYAAIDERTHEDDAYGATDYLEQLDGLGYDEVLTLAGGPDEIAKRVEAEASRDRASQSGGSTQSARARTKGLHPEYEPVLLAPATARVLNEAIQTVMTKDFAGARAALEELELDRLTPYERSTTELILAEISVAEEKWDESREHLRSAVQAGGLTEEEVADALGRMRQIDSWLARSSQ